MNIELTEEEINKLMRIISTAPWIEANPLMHKINQQMQRQIPQGNSQSPPNMPEMPMKSH
jgi:hypothetical protein